MVPSVTLAQTTDSSANNRPHDSIQSILSEQSIDIEVNAIQKSLLIHNFPFNYKNSVGILENLSYSALVNITRAPNFLSYLDSYSNSSQVYLTQGMTYNYSTQQYGVYANINVLGNASQITLTFAYASNNKTIYGPQIINESQTLASSENYSWAGYEFYDPGNGISYNNAQFNVSNISLPSFIVSPTAMAAWIGMTDIPGGTDGNMVQTGYSRWHYGDYPGIWEPYENWYQTWIKGTGVYYQLYNNISYSYPGWVLDFSINYVSSANKVDYSLIAENVSEVSTALTPYYVTSMYAQYMVEAPYNKDFGQSQIAVFHPNEIFMYPSVVNTAGISMNLNTLHGNGDFVLDIMNQFPSYPNNENIYDLSTWQQSNGQWFWEPDMQYNNSLTSISG